MDDLISRKWLMECVNEGWITFDTEKDTNTYTHLVRDIAPSVQPEWIPCDERLPELNEDVLVFSRKGDIRISTFLKINETSFWVNYEYGYYELLDSVIAWMPLPKPYKEGDGNETN